MKVIKLALIIGILALMPANTWALNGGEGLAGTAHDFTMGNVANNPDAGATNTAVGLCTFCHTPHKALSTLLLWNHKLSVNNFSWDVPNTTAGTPFAKFTGNVYKGVTAKCLSCHDGSVAIGDVAWFKEGPASLNPNKHDTKGGEFNIGLGGDMSGNHPVAMPYPANSTKSSYNGSTTGNSIVLADWVADPTAGSRIRLFNDDGSGNITAGVVTGKTGLECSSCHDPHNKDSVDDLFLRGKLTGSSTGDGYLCLQCHQK